MNRKQLRADAEDLLIDAKDLRERIALEQPSRLPTAQLLFDDTLRVYNLVESAGHLTAKKRREIAARLTRACLLSEALNHAVQ